MIDYRTEAPPILRDFLVYHETIQGHSRATVDEYFLDLRSFFRFLKLDKGRVAEEGTHEELTAKRGIYYELVKNQLELGN